MTVDDARTVIHFIGRLAAALLLCGVIGLERQHHNKDAGVRTHALVGLGAALFTAVGVISTAGPEGLSANVDSTRIAAQVVSGVGFLGAGVIFVDRDAVRGLTTAGAIWLSAAVGTACGAGYWAVAASSVVLYLLLVVLAAPLLAKVPTTSHRVVATISYTDQRGALREIMSLAGEDHARAVLLSSEMLDSREPQAVRVRMAFESPGSLSDLVSQIADLRYVLSVDTDLKTASDE